jgi:prephenate dehydratase
MRTVADGEGAWHLADVNTSDRPRVAFQGELGAYSEDAIQFLFGASSEAVPYASYADAAAAVVAGTADIVVFPIENTIVGSVGETHDAVDRTAQLHAVGEVVVDVHHCLMGPFGATVDSVSTVLSDPLALAQCQEFFRKHPRIQTHGLFDTASAAREVAQLGDPNFAAVAARTAAARHNLDVLAANIEDRRDNQTRFLAFATAPKLPPVGTPVRTMIAFTTRDAPGALLAVLQPFANHGVNLRRIDTRPTGVPWSYRFFVELDHEIGNVRADAAIRAVERVSAAMRLVGTFPRWKAGTRASIGWVPTDLPVIA